MQPNTLRPLLLALFCVSVWGVSYAVIRSTVQQIPPLTLACVRHLAGALLLWPLVVLRGAPARLAGSDHLVMFALGLSGVSLYFAFENHGLMLTSASHGALIIALIPLGTEIVHAWRRRILPAPGTWIGTAAALAGVLLLVGHDDGVATLEGDLLMLGAVASWIVYSFLVQRYARRYPSLLLTRQLMLYGALALLPGSAFELWQLRPGWPDSGAWGGLLFLTVICSVIAYDCWNRAVPELGATRVNTLLYLVPLFGVFSGVLFLDEPFTPQLLTGGALIFGGVLLARGRAPQPAIEGTRAG